MKRKPLSKSIRFDVLNRDNFTCQYCGKSAPDVRLEVDHIKPVSKGGTDDLSNLVTACEACNKGKSNKEIKPQKPRVLRRTLIAKEQKYCKYKYIKVDEETYEKIHSFAVVSGFSDSEMIKSIMKEWKRVDYYKSRCDQLEYDNDDLKLRLEGWKNATIKSNEIDTVNKLFSIVFEYNRLFENFIISKEEWTRIKDDTYKLTVELPKWCKDWIQKHYTHADKYIESLIKEDMFSLVSPVSGD